MANETTRVSEPAEEAEGVYERQAREFLETHGLRVNAVHHGDKCPPWGKCDKGECWHGDRFRVTLIRTGPIPELDKQISFDYWNSRNDAADGETTVSPYDVLSCIASDATMPTNADAVVEEMGQMPPSQAIAIAFFARRLQRFFSAAELRDLGEIQ